MRLEPDVGNFDLVTVDFRDPTPLYVQLARILTAQIAAGKLAPHDPLPSEAYLQQEYGVSRATVRRAVAHLRDQGVVYTLPQRGTFVAESDS